MEITSFGFIGLGLIGGSICKALKNANPNYKITAYDINQDALLLAKEEKSIDVIATSVDASFAACQMIFLCVPVISNNEYLSALAPFLSPETILTDVGSVKTGIHQAIHAAGLDDLFIGGHPMAGSERIGYANSKAEILENAYYILTPTKTVSSEKIEAFTHLIQEMHALPLRLTYEEHDYVTAAISHLPHVISASLVNLVRDEDSTDGVMKLIAAGGFKDITRISSSSPVMWQHICLSNKDNILTLLNDYIDSLGQIRVSIEHQDEQELYDFFDSARCYRDSFIEANSGPIKKAFILRMELADKAGALAEVAMLLAINNISIKNIGIIHNREYEAGALHIEFYDNAALMDAKELLTTRNYILYE